MVNGTKFMLDPKSNKALPTNKSFIDTGILKLQISLASLLASSTSSSFRLYISFFKTTHLPYNFFK